MKRSKLENELASLSQKEKTLENDLRTLEEKKLSPSWRGDQSEKVGFEQSGIPEEQFGKKLNELQGKLAGSQAAEEPHTNGETA